MENLKLATATTVLAIVVSLMASPTSELRIDSPSLEDRAPSPPDPIDFPKIVSSVALARDDWRETPTAHEISVDVPAMKRGEVRVEVEERVLTVSWERKSEEEVKDEKWHSVERTVSKFWRQFKLPGNADVENLRARLGDGVLNITVPKLADGDKKREPKVIRGDNAIKAATNKQEL